jgi:hypothetical protein
VQRRIVDNPTDI